MFLFCYCQKSSKSKKCPVTLGPGLLKVRSLVIFALLSVMFVSKEFCSETKEKWKNKFFLVIFRKKFDK